MNLPSFKVSVVAASIVVVALAFFAKSTGTTATTPDPAKPALAVQTVQPRSEEMTQRLAASGNVAAWQEASLGSEVAGLRLIDVKVNVGAQVKRGQVLAEFAGEMPLAEQAQTRAALAEARAAQIEAHANADRARGIESTGALSALQIGQYLTAEATAQARLDAALANLALADLRLAHTRVLASDDGTISYRSPAATVGAVVPQGQELFRLIRQNRLEWRAEVASSELGRIRPGQNANIVSPAGASTAGKVRSVAPTVDTQTRNALVYVDLPPAATGGDHPPFKAGMFARGEFELGKSVGPTLPRQAVAMRDGFSFVFLVGADSRVAQTRVQVGRRDGERVEITGGLPPGAPVVAAGAGFLNDGDLVKVVDVAAGGSLPAKAK